MTRMMSNRVLVDELRMPVASQEHAEVMNQVTTPWSFTPFTRKIVSGVLFLRTW